MPEQKMSSGEALVIVRKVKNHYQAFEELEDVLDAVLAAEKSVGGLNRQMTKLTDEVAELVVEAKSRKDMLSKVGEDLAAKRKEVAMEHKSFMDGISGAVKRARSEHKEVMASMQAAYEEKRKGIETSTEELRKERNKQERLLANAREAVAKTREGLERVA